VTPTLHLVSFGFQHRDHPPAATAMIDVRWLPSPAAVAALDDLSGRDHAVRTWLLGEHLVADWCDSLLDALMPQLAAASRLPSGVPPEATWAFGCDTGYDRSVVIAEYMAEMIHRSTHLAAVVDHLDIHRGGR
jgi:RNase adapter protein RapZ